MLIVVCAFIVILGIIAFFMFLVSITEESGKIFLCSLGMILTAGGLAYWIDSSYNATEYKLVESKEYVVYPVEYTAVIAVGERVEQLGPPYCGWEKVRVNKYEDGTDDFFYFGGYEEKVNPAETEE